MKRCLFPLSQLLASLLLGVSALTSPAQFSPFSPFAPKQSQAAGASDYTTGIQLWLDASDASTLFQDAGFTTPATANDDPIGGWQDKSGNAFHVTGAGGVRPLLQTAFLNSKSVVKFDGADDVLTKVSAAVLKNVPSAAVFVVIRFWAPAVGEVPLFVGTGAGATRFIVRTDLSGFFSAGGRRLDADSFADVASGSAPVSTLFYTMSASVDYTATTLTLFTNGIQAATSASFQTSGSTENTDATPLNIGASTGAFSTCYLAEVRVYPTLPSAGNVTLILNALKTKWGHY